MMNGFIRRIALCLVVTICLIQITLAGETTSKKITGKVTDNSSQPVVGATIRLISDTSYVTGTTSNESGLFSIKILNDVNKVSLRVSSIGYQPITIQIGDSREVEIKMTPLIYDIGKISVEANQTLSDNHVKVSNKTITRASAGSLIPGNPTSAIEHPTLEKVGSNHSSQIRFSGTSPEYYLNGSSIGSDPNHFGVFSLLPSSVVENLEYSAVGTDITSSAPAMVNFETPVSFTPANKKELELSTVAMNGSFKYSTNRVFTVGSLRKSVLDKITSEEDPETKRRTIPPTNFQDIFLSSGVRLSSQYRLIFDQYHVRDYLSFNTTSAVSFAEPTKTQQAAKEQFYGLRLQRLSNKSLIEISTGLRNSLRQYVAQPINEGKSSNVMIDLRETVRTYQTRVKVDVDLTKIQFKTGYELESIDNREITLRQTNWNFQPPFSNTDNPFVYQMAINSLYHSYASDNPQSQSALYFSATYPKGALSFSSGIRVENISHMQKGTSLLQRHAIAMKFSNKSEIRLSYGTYSENPATTILEENQILVRHYLNDLGPIHTQLTSLDISSGNIHLNIYRKWISSLPSLSPDFNNVYIESGILNPDFLRMRSEGSADFYGFSVELVKSKLIWNNLTINGSYGYSHATKTEHGIRVPYDLDSPHRLTTEIGYKPHRKIDLSANFVIRSGYPYSPTRPIYIFSEENNYTQEYYNTYLAGENSLRFPVNTTLNISAQFDFGKAGLTLAVTNLTNRYNPIIRAASGFVYDAGILPSVGFTWKF